MACCLIFFLPNLKGRTLIDVALPSNFSSKSKVQSLQSSTRSVAALNLPTGETRKNNNMATKAGKVAVAKATASGASVGKLAESFNELDISNASTVGTSKYTEMMQHNHV